jgi:endonuclease/exonuclease/phosphatase family metal-dependent hydrolase
MNRVGIIILMFLIFGCVTATEKEQVPPIINDSAKENLTSFEKNMTDNITIAAFNVQVFGKSKSEKEEVMEILAKTMRNFDIVAMQEIRDKGQTALPLLIEKINSMPGEKYNYTVGPRLGRTSSKEQYAYIYNSKIKLLSNYTFNDTEDKFHREPYIARFVSEEFDFVLLVFHSDPDETPQELDDLPIVLNQSMEEYSDEEDFIILGDLNADCNYLKESDNVSLREYIWLINDEDTTTKSTVCNYDRIIITNATVDEYIQSGVFKFDLVYELNQSMTEEVSDHYPVWASFTVQEILQEE